MRDWSETDFKTRVETRVAQLGLPEYALLRAAGLSGDEIRKVPKRGRRIDTIFGIARALQWTIGQAIGVQDPTLFLEREREIDPAKLARAMMIAEEGIGASPEGRGVGTLADATSLVYSVLAERETAGEPVDDESARILISSLLRRFFPK